MNCKNKCKCKNKTNCGKVEKLSEINIIGDNMTVPVNTIVYDLTDTPTFTIDSIQDVNAFNNEYTHPTYNQLAGYSVKTHPDIFGDVERFQIAGDQIPGQTLQDLYVNLITEEYNEFIEAVKAGDRVGQLDGILDMIVVSVGYARAAGFNFNESWDEVQASNMSKVDPTTGKCIKDNNGKIQKPASYFKPNLKPFV
jgi:hypothetical protein